MTAGRPTEFSQETANKICESIATSPDGIRKICEEAGIAVSTWQRWLAERKELQEQYAHAKEAQADGIFGEIIEIADTVLEGVKTKTTGEGEDAKIETTTGDMVERAKLKVDARKWVVARLAPKKYGDFARNEISGPDGGPVELKTIAGLLSGAHEN